MRLIKIILLFVLIILMGCDDEVTEPTPNQPTVSRGKFGKIVCNEFGMAYYEVETTHEDKFTYVPVVTNPLTFASCESYEEQLTNYKLTKRW